jgi:hypothetical protein
LLLQFKKIKKLIVPLFHLLDECLTNDNHIMIFSFRHLELH